MAKGLGSIGKFQVLGTLGTGAHSTILHIRRQADGTQYALKVVPLDGAEDQKYLEQAKHEYRVAQMVNHPNLIKVYTLETVRDWLFRPRKLHLLIEYVNGKTLDTLPRLSVPRLVQIFAKVAAGLSHMHRRGVYHADLKPNNILLSKAGDVKIIDFGLAWIHGERKGRIQGTPEYMAPEQVKQKLVNEGTDIYNLGATLYRLLTLRLPPSPLVEGSDLQMDSRSRAALLKPVQECNPDAPRELCDLIHSCLSASPARRPQRMTDIQETLTQLGEELGAASAEGLEELE
jgi:eukaryotic-like serine/threonine-protein kinase